jgi:plasmid stability protein
MPVAVTIRHVPDEVRNQLAARAAIKGWSLQEFLLHELIDLSNRPDREALVAQLRSRLVGRKPVRVGEIVDAISVDRR